MKINRHTDYSFEGSLENEIFADPMVLFANWYRTAEMCEVAECNAFHLSTVDPMGFPDGRIVLLKEFTDQGFVFFTNYLSKKGRDLLNNPRASMTFFWPSQMRQIRIAGGLSILSHDESEEYFSSRPLDSRISAMISRQSAPLDSRLTLEKEFAETKASLGQTEPHCPSWWGGYLLLPERIEFWQGRPNRMHDRVFYQKGSEGWQHRLLYP